MSSDMFSLTVGIICDTGCSSIPDSESYLLTSSVAKVAADSVNCLIKPSLNPRGIRMDARNGKMRRFVFPGVAMKESQRIWMLWFSLILSIVTVGVMPNQRCYAADIDLSIVPEYVTAGLEEYAANGYEAAVHTWFADSPYSNAATLASNHAFFKNIEMLAGKYRSYDILMTKQTATSNAVYVRINYERLPGYIMFTSIKNQDRWVLSRLSLDRMQRFGS